MQETETDECLNLWHHTRELVIKALNRSDTKKQAAALLGISTRTMSRYLRSFAITFIEKKKTYK
jgi:transcriptional regulator with GAF, ATPase, and Fis domain